MTELRPHRKWGHIWYWAFAGLVYLVFFSLEKIITTQYTPMHCFVDDWFPFNEWFILPYVAWYVYLAGVAVYTFFWEPEVFRRYAQFYLWGFVVAIIIFIIFPNGQNLRPASVEGDSIAAELVRFIYRNDTNTNALPSMHVIGSVAPTIALSRCPRLKGKKGVLLLTILFTILICVSTLFVKQHSFLDILAGLVICVPLQIFTFRRGEFLQWYADFLDRTLYKNSKGTKFDA